MLSVSNIFCFLSGALILASLYRQGRSSRAARVSRLGHDRDPSRESSHALFQEIENHDFLDSTARAIREIRVEVSDSDFERLSFGFLDLIIGFTECDETRIDRGSAHLISELRGHQAEKTELKNWAQQYVEDLELFRSQRGFDEMIRVGRQSPRS